MAYTDPKTDWDEDYEPGPEDLNRIEGNVKAIKEEIIDFDGDKTFNDDVDVAGNVAITGTLTAATLDTGQGANELYDMDQNVTTTSNVTFNNITANGIITGARNQRSYTETGIDDETFYVAEGVWAIAIENVSLISTPTYTIQMLVDGDWINLVSTQVDPLEKKLVSTGQCFTSNGSNLRITVTALASGSLTFRFYGL